MKIVEFITEGGKFILGRAGKPGGSHKGKISRKFRCTSGPRRGRIVANIATCHAPIKASAKKTMTVTRARRPAQTAFKSKMTKKGSGISRAVSTYNKGLVKAVKARPVKTAKEK